MRKGEALVRAWRLDDSVPMRLFVSPKIRDWLYAAADGARIERPKVNVTDYSKLKPCCPGKSKAAVAS